MAIDGPPRIMALAINHHERPVQIQLPMSSRSHPFRLLHADLSGEPWAKSVSKEASSSIAHYNFTLMQQIPDIENLQRETEVQHHRLADHLRRSIEAARSEAIC